MIYIRGHPQDYEEWGARHTGWDYNAVLPVFKRMECNRSVPALSEEYHGFDGGLHVTSPDKDLMTLPLNEAFLQSCQSLGFGWNDDFNSGTNTTFGCGYYQSNTKDGERCSAWLAHCEKLMDPAAVSEFPAASNFFVATDSFVTTLHVDARTRTIVSIDAVHRDPVTRKLQRKSPVTRISPCQVVVSMGAIHSPALLLRSGIGDAAALKAVDGITPTHHLPGVGLNLTEHFDAVFVSSISQYTPSRSTSLANLGFTMRQALAYAQQRRGVFSNVVETGAFAFADRSLNHLSVEEQRLRKLKPNIQFHFITAPLIDHARVVTTYDGLSLHACNLYPKSRGSVTIDSADPGKDPVVDYRYLEHPDDVEVMISGCHQMLEILNSASFTKFNLKPIRPTARIIQEALSAPPQDRAYRLRAAIEATLRRYGDNVYHPMGTCSMGAVVDERLKVWDLKNLRVADASVVPYSLGGNTNAPCQMIGARCAEFLVEDTK
jgi:choline dehydrogenase-like flavoprotein